MNLGGTVRLNKFGMCVGSFLFFLLIVYMVSKADSQSKKVDLRKLLIASVEAAISGGKEVVLVHKSEVLNERSKGKTKEGANDPVTSADERSNCAMYYSLVHTFPGVTVISEEQSKESDCRILQTLDLDEIVLGSAAQLQEEEVNLEDITIWIDPLDATVEFTQNLLEYVTTMVCVAVKGVPTLGVIHKPFGSEPKTSWAWVGKHVSKNLENIKQSDSSNKRISIIVSKSHTGDVEQKAKTVFGDNINIIQAGGAGYKSLEVASGNVTLYLHTTIIKKWDICAGNAIINAVKGTMTDLKSETITYFPPSKPKEAEQTGLIAVLGNNNDIAERIKNALN